MDILIKILQLVLSLSLLVFVHELGHFLSARMFGIKVEKFYLFFDAWGFSLFKFKRGDTTYGIGWVPLGGYVKIAGMIDESMDTEQMKQPAKPWEFRSKPTWQRLIVMVAGVVMNVLTACVIFIGMSWHWGDSYLANKDAEWGYSFSPLAQEIGFANGDRILTVNGSEIDNYNEIGKAILLEPNTIVTVLRGDERMDIRVSDVYTSDLLKSKTPFLFPRMPFVVHAVAGGGVADKAGIKAGDTFVAFDTVPMSMFDDFVRVFSENIGNTVSLTVERQENGTKTPHTVQLTIPENGKIGVESVVPFEETHIDYTLWQSIPAGFRKAGTEISNYWAQLKMIVKPQTEAYKQVGSFIAIGNIFPSQWSWQSFWRITAFLSIVLAIMNILPIPALDGGHVMFLVWEMITGRKPSDKFMEWAQMVGLILLFMLLIFAFGNDIYRFIIK